ncbi:oligoribonuclease [Sansalvadorimonas sp. 2012CJ34-2]|uniref:Oligoribonuclease n=1 Tax=Parendozoicomonas callyspongiae TaxID=2942213 RepID=A0ABT0PL25_9GAMM|nr:oligoribonuclease [Sansalvadorimonas sp. 2012CJ34-2]MCL6271971.1 oligoribonuclease [Sansalvadorimonas sp. 2012CJ34-2]
MQADNLVWLDLEMTGLDPRSDCILEVATIVTDANLNVLAEGPVIAVHQPDSVLDTMNEWCIETHGKTGLTERVRQSTVSEAEAEQITIDFLKQYVEPGKSPMCGNTIGQDRRFLFNYMSDLHDFFHYRNIDVSTLKELARRWKPELLNGFNKDGSHKAIEDIRESIDEMKYYREHFIKL